MRFRGWVARFFSCPELERLRTENVALSSALKNANEKASDLSARLLSAQEREAEALRESRENLKIVANYAVRSAGSRVAIFDGVGPTMPSTKYAEKHPDPIRGPVRASQMAKLQNERAVQEYLEHEQALAEESARKEQASA